MANERHSTMTRRQALTGTAAGAAAIVAGTTPALTVQTPDPTFAAIEAHKAAAVRFEAAVDDEQRLEEELPADARQSRHWGGDMWIKPTDDPQWIAALNAWRETCDAVDGLAWEFIEHPPTTTAGVAALMAYIVDSPEGWFPDGFQPAINRVLAGALARTGGAS